MAHRPVLTNSVIVGIVALALGTVLYTNHRQKVFEEVPWVIQGQLFDANTNPLANVRVRILNVLRTTASFKAFPSSSIALETNTDTQGAFIITLRAAAYQIAFHKPGYVDEVQSFGCIGTHCDNTNQNLQIFLNPEKATPGPK